MVRRYSVTIILLSLAIVWSLSVAHGQDNRTTDQWAVNMFAAEETNRSHDFGSVALHADVQHRFVFRNIYKEDVVIQSVKSNCGCTKASVTKKVIRSGEIGEIIAQIDTSGKEHTKRRKATVTVLFDAPTRAEVQLQVTTYIRADVGFDPGAIEFGTVAQGKTISKKVHLQYEGNPNWALTSIKKTSPAIKAEAREISRRAGRVSYEITVELLKDAAPGYLNGILTFSTNETNTTTASVFLPVRGLIMAPLTAKPSHFQLGVLHPGEEVTKNIVLHGVVPFKVLQVNSQDIRMTFAIAPQESAVHVIPVTFKANKVTGEIDQMISIKTSDRSTEPINIAVTGRIVNKQEIKEIRETEKTRETNGIEEIAENTHSTENAKSMKSEKIAETGVLPLLKLPDAIAQRLEEATQTITVEKPIRLDEWKKAQSHSVQLPVQEKKLVAGEPSLKALPSAGLTSLVEKNPAKEISENRVPDKVGILSETTQESGGILFRKPTLR